MIKLIASFLTMLVLSGSCAFSDCFVLVWVKERTGAMATGNDLYQYGDITHIWDLSEWADGVSANENYSTIKVTGINKADLLSYIVGVSDAVDPETGIWLRRYQIRQGDLPGQHKKKVFTDRYAVYEWSFIEPFITDKLTP